VAQAKSARVVDVRALGADTRLIDLEVAPLGFVGGQYLIVNSGVVLDGGKLAKRAYSILSPDARQDRVQLAVKRVGDGPGSNFMHRAQVGDELPFSGPWGQYLPDDARPRVTWVIATDTGITAALGLLRGEKFSPQRARAELCWMKSAADYFLPDGFVREAAGIARCESAALAPVGAAARIGEARDWLRARLTGGARPDSAFLSGDGAVIGPLRDELIAAGVDAAAIRLEAFFNNPQKKSV
jgi:ferredoxin-NADP reductase